MTTSRNWLVLFINSEVLRRYQWPVGVERVLAEHIAAVAALPIAEYMDTCAAPIEAPAADTQAGEACMHCGSLAEGRRARAVRGAPKNSFPARLVVVYCN